MTWNVTGLMSSSSYLSNTLNQQSIDFCGISEHWLYNYNLHFFDVINTKYKIHAVCDFDLDKISNRRVGKGGVAIMWLKKHNNNVTPLTIDDDRIVGLQFQIAPNQFAFIFQVYLPCRNHPIQAFKDYIDKLYNLWSLYSENGLVVFMGDFNANLLNNSTQDSRNAYLKKFLNDTICIAANTLNICEGAKSSFVSYDGSSESLIDHIILPIERTDSISKCEILDDNCLNVSRHRPVICSVNIPTLSDVENNSGYNNYSINWNKIKQTDKYKYESYLKNSNELKTACNMIQCKNDIDHFYDVLVQNIQYTSDNSFPKYKFRDYLKPYWNDSLTNAHKEMKDRRNMWLKDGRPRDSNVLSYKYYKMSKRNFRKLHRYYVDLYLTNLDREIDKTAELEKNQFWKLVNKRRKRSNTRAGSEIKFNGTVYRDQQCLTDQWKQYFKTLYTPTNNILYDNDWKSEIDNKVNSLIHDTPTVPDCTTVTFDEVTKALQTCKKGKACGIDNIFYEHFMYGGDTLIYVLSKLYSSMLRLSHTPVLMNKGIIITLHKGGKKLKNDPNNYRAITLSPTILKIYENVLLMRSKENILSKLNLQQGGFQENLGCSMTSFSLKECILYGKENKSKVFACFLDARQAFDRVWHHGLFFKLHATGIDNHTFLAFVDIYRNMQSCVRNRHILSDWFSVLQGTRQ